jgi:hypothetical protein
MQMKLKFELPLRIYDPEKGYFVFQGLPFISDVTAPNILFSYDEGGGLHRESLTILGRGAVHIGYVDQSAGTADLHYFYAAGHCWRLVKVPISTLLGSPGATAKDIVAKWDWCDPDDQRLIPANPTDQRADDLRRWALSAVTGSLEAYGSRRGVR